MLSLRLVAHKIIGISSVVEPPEVWVVCIHGRKGAAMFDKSLRTFRFSPFSHLPEALGNSAIRTMVFSLGSPCVH